ncbi:Ankyrin repeat protein 1 [Giardia muris]|uniref:Ankyrin repeat protein 1 n=1 Tax=Giardia muris TaxID=5742 RepID=A0A4Z1STU2_GIAMU|nr:Ankyrin repeat protein 1 [Giardia muris]|eukprot:TNJ29160.1 Ankyrin repeat protein 1 [Giardia muris]
MPSAPSSWFESARNGDAEAVAASLEKYARSTRETGETALIEAAGTNSVPVIKLLIPRESCMVNKNGISALMQAALLNCAEAAEVLAPHEFMILLPDRRDAFMLAAARGNLETMKVIHSFFSLHDDEYGMSALDYAVAENRLRAVEFIVVHHVTIKDELEHAISLAIEREFYDVLDVLRASADRLQQTNCRESRRYDGLIREHSLADSSFRASRDGRRSLSQPSSIQVQGVSLPTRPDNSESCLATPRNNDELIRENQSLKLEVRALKEQADASAEIIDLITASGTAHPYTVGEKVMAKRASSLRSPNVVASEATKNTSNDVEILKLRAELAEAKESITRIASQQQQQVPNMSMPSIAWGSGRFINDSADPRRDSYVIGATDPVTAAEVEHLRCAIEARDREVADLLELHQLQSGEVPEARAKSPPLPPESLVIPLHNPDIGKLRSRIYSAILRSNQGGSNESYPQSASLSGPQPVDRTSLDNKLTTSIPLSAHASQRVTDGLGPGSASMHPSIHGSRPTSARSNTPVINRALQPQQAVELLDARDVEISILREQLNTNLTGQGGSFTLIREEDNEKSALLREKEQELETVKALLAARDDELGVLRERLNAERERCAALSEKAADLPERDLEITRLQKQVEELQKGMAPTHIRAPDLQSIHEMLGNRHADTIRLSSVMVPFKDIPADPETIAETLKRYAEDVKCLIVENNSLARDKEHLSTELKRLTESDAQWADRAAAKDAEIASLREKVSTVLREASRPVVVQPHPSTETYEAKLKEKEEEAERMRKEISRLSIAVAQAKCGGNRDRVRELTQSNNMLLDELREKDAQLEEMRLVLSTRRPSSPGLGSMSSDSEKDALIRHLTQALKEQEQAFIELQAAMADKTLETEHLWQANRTQERALSHSVLAGQLQAKSARGTGAVSPVLLRDDDEVQSLRRSLRSTSNELNHLKAALYAGNLVIDETRARQSGASFGSLTGDNSRLRTPVNTK